jgi:hypothetical protein
MVAMIEVLFDFRDHAHRGLDGDREARTGRRRSASPQRSEGRQAARFLFPRGMREEQGKKRAAWPLLPVARAEGAPGQISH